MQKAITATIVRHREPTPNTKGTAQRPLPIDAFDPAVTYRRSLPDCHPVETLLAAFLFCISLSSAACIAAARSAGSGLSISTSPRSTSLEGKTAMTWVPLRTNVRVLEVSQLTAFCLICE